MSDTGCPDRAKYFVLKGLGPSVARWMRLRLLVRCLPFAVLAGWWGMVPQAADAPRERRVSERMLIGNPGGEIVRLSTQGVPFVGIYGESTERPLRGGVVLLHDLDRHPLDSGLLQALREQLPQHAWDVLAIQLPLAPEDRISARSVPQIKEAFPRIALALEYFKQRNINKIVVAGQGYGARVTVEWMAQSPGDAAQGLVLISLESDPQDKTTAVNAALAKVKLPVLEVHAEADREAVLAGLQTRKQIVTAAENTTYRQLVIPATGPNYANAENLTAQRIRAWLNRQLGGAAKK